MKYLARREHSRAELHTKLQAYAQEGDDLERVLDELEDRDWLSDARAAALLVSSKRNRFGAQRIAYELRQRGIAESLIDAVLPQLQGAELEAARAVWQKKFSALPQDAKEKARQVRFLQSRGFSLEVIFSVLRHTRSDD